MIKIVWSQQFLLIPGTSIIRSDRRAILPLTAAPYNASVEQDLRPQMRQGSDSAAQALALPRGNDAFTK